MEALESYCFLGIPCQIKGTDATAFYVTDPRSGLPGRTEGSGQGPFSGGPLSCPSLLVQTNLIEKKLEKLSPNSAACACTQL